MSSVRINFVNREPEKWLSMFPEGSSADSIEVSRNVVFGRNTFIVTTFLALRNAGLDVSLTRHLDEDCVNVLHYDDLEPGWRYSRYLIVAIRSDRDPVMVCDFEVMNNAFCCTRFWHRFIPHWPQPGLIRRDSKRGTRLEVLAFMGRKRNLAPEFRTDKFEHQLREIGVEFRIVERGWWDYSEVDAVLAARVDDPYLSAVKPASKLVNAWHAGVPALIVEEPAYRELRETDLDYRLISDADSVVNELRRLKDSPDVYASIVENGLSRAKSFTHEEVRSKWIQLLETEGGSAHHRLREKGVIGRSLRQLRYMMLDVLRRMWGKQVRFPDDKGLSRSNPSLLGRLKRTVLAPIVGAPRSGYR